MSVDCEADLRRATVYYDTLGGADDDEHVLEALGDVRHRLQGAIGRQARVTRTPELLFTPDDVSRGAARPEAVFRTIHDDEARACVAPQGHPVLTAAPSAPTPAAAPPPP